MTHKAIPTKYTGHTFRSRLEARWAAFFDVCEWDWEYEPVDLDGWIPDFRLTSRAPECSRYHRTSVLVEVKPINEFCQETADKIERASKTSESWCEVLLLGSRIIEQDDRYNPRSFLGWLWERGYYESPKDGPPDNQGWDRAAFTNNRGGLRYPQRGYNSRDDDLVHNRWPYDFCAEYGAFTCRLSGFYEGGSTRDIPYAKAKRIWGKASSAVQYKGSEASE